MSISQENENGIIAEMYFQKQKPIIARKGMHRPKGYVLEMDDKTSPKHLSKEHILYVVIDTK